MLLFNLIVTIYKFFALRSAPRIAQCQSRAEKVAGDRVAKPISRHKLSYGEVEEICRKAGNQCRKIK